MCPQMEAIRHAPPTLPSNQSPDPPPPLGLPHHSISPHQGHPLTPPYLDSPFDQAQNGECHGHTFDLDNPHLGFLQNRLLVKVRGSPTPRTPTAHQEVVSGLPPHQH